ncbi:MAG: hypothetical protein QXU18_10285 [Thermoplasmatales archaeon]
MNDLKCHISYSDKIPVEELCNDPTSFEGEVLLFCERKHVLAFTKNPGNSPLQPSSTSQYYETLPDTYPQFFKNHNDIVFQQFTDIFNLRQLEYWSGTSFAIRSLCETLIYSNYGIYAYYGDVVLGSKTDRIKIDEVYKKIRKIGFGPFMTIVISSEWRDNFINGNQEFFRRKEFEGARLEYAVDAAKNLKEIADNGPWISTDNLKKVAAAFDKLSPIVHSREIVDPDDIDKSLKAVLNAYEEFYTNNSKWRINYEQ